MKSQVWRVIIITSELYAGQRDLGHNLNREVVAEGVESEAVWERLAALNCDAAQGYFIAEPIPAEQFPDWEAYSHWSEFRTSHSPVR